MPINSYDDGEGFGDGGVCYGGQVMRPAPGGYRRMMEIQGGVRPEPVEEVREVVKVDVMPIADVAIREAGRTDAIQ